MPDVVGFFVVDLADVDGVDGVDGAVVEAWDARVLEAALCDGLGEHARPVVLQQNFCCKGDHIMPHCP